MLQSIKHNTNVLVSQLLNAYYLLLYFYPERMHPNNIDSFEINYLDPLYIFFTNIEHLLFLSLLLVMAKGKIMSLRMIPSILHPGMTQYRLQCFYPWSINHIW